jgi:3-oxoacyl-[acyl-carrier-protein] synthase II
MKDHRGMRAIAVTGIGLVTPLGFGVVDSWAGLVAGRSGVRPITRFPTLNMKTSFAASVMLPEEEAGRFMSTAERMERYASMAGEEALAIAGLGGRGGFPGPLVLGMPPIEIELPDRLAILHRAGQPNYRAMTDVAADPDLARHTLFSAPPAALADRFGTRGAPMALSTACATGVTAIQMGMEAIRFGEAEAVLCLSTEASIQQEAVMRFSLLSALSTRNDAPEKASRPFDATRDGFVMAEGAACLVLESAEHASARGAKILGWALGGGEQADGFHRTRSNPDGSTIISAMHRAIADAGLEPAQIDYVNAHGTSTPENDKMEALGIQAVFGETPPPVSSNKSQIGHSISASGAIEAVFSLLTIRDQKLPPTINYETPDPAITLDVVPNEARDARVARVLSNSFGFGGQNSCLVLGAEPTS